ncbi:class II glutamine amidotransferase, partial [Streptomyces sp. NPDC018026]
DDDPHWQEVPDRTLLTASRTDVRLTPLKDPGGTTAPALGPTDAFVSAKEPRT